MKRSEEGEWICYDACRKENMNGTSDPFWPDGVNINLCRNHIIYDKQQLAEFCSQNEYPTPEEMYLPIPPIVDANLFIDPTSDRAKRIISTPGWRCCNPRDDGLSSVTVEAKFEPAQLCLF